MAGKSPFKLLDAYGKQDKDIFFGRAEEVEALYEMAYQANCILVYGPSGSGKTSLIQCGLANRFQPSDWFDIYIRRGENINASLQRALDAYELAEVEAGTLIGRLEQIKTYSPDGFQAVEPRAPASATTCSLRAIYEYHLKPVYLIFDQFEELYILGNEQEQQAFYHTIAGILETEEYCRVMLVLREEYLASLDEFEKVAPYLFDKRLRVEPMARHNTNEVIVGTTEKFGIRLGEEDTSSLIIDALSRGQKRVELTYLQVFLDKLFRKASEKALPGKVVFDNHLVQGLGHIENILGEFLDNQSRLIQGRLQQQYPEAPPDAVKKVLSAFVTLEGTKQPLKKEDALVPGLNAEQLDFCLGQLERSRLLRLEGGLYELSHDALAQQVAQERSAEEVALLQAAKIVKDRYSAYEATQSLLNNNELHLLAGFQEKLKAEGCFSPEEWAFIRRSAWENRRWRMIRFGIVLFSMLVLVAFSVYSQYYRREAEKQTVIATEALDHYKVVQAERDSVRFNELLGKARIAMSESHYDDALAALDNALVFNDSSREAIAMKQEAETKMSLKGAFNRLMAEGDSLLLLGETSYLDALDKYREAAGMGFANKRAEAKMSSMQEKLFSAFEKFKSAGDAFYEARGYRHALNAYRQAARIQPGDPSIQGRIEECRQKMGSR